jgi:hypothetical protein
VTFTDTFKVHTILQPTDYTDPHATMDPIGGTDMDLALAIVAGKLDIFLEKGRSKLFERISYDACMGRDDPSQNGANAQDSIGTTADGPTEVDAATRAKNAEQHAVNAMAFYNRYLRFTGDGTLDPILAHASKVGLADTVLKLHGIEPEDLDADLDEQSVLPSCSRILEEGGAALFPEEAKSGWYSAIRDTAPAGLDLSSLAETLKRPCSGSFRQWLAYQEARSMMKRIQAFDTAASCANSYQSRQQPGQQPQGNDADQRQGQVIVAMLRRPLSSLPSKGLGPWGSLRTTLWVSMQLAAGAVVRDGIISVDDAFQETDTIGRIEQALQ